ncbi:MAG: hypothetical protein IPP51_07690 [Bacteroidetes bacterium]|nr:hypothetical protein [Bacteroidota bacterium]
MGGSLSNGTLFVFNPTSNTLTKLYDFGTTVGTDPSGNLIQASDGKLYGYTLTTLFSYDISLNTVSLLHTFLQTGTSGFFLYGSPFQSANGKLYGTTRDGGLYGNGTIFTYDISTSTFANIHDNNVPEANFPKSFILHRKQQSTFQ